MTSYGSTGILASLALGADKMRCFQNGRYDNHFIDPTKTDGERTIDRLNYAREDALDSVKDFISGGGDCQHDRDCNAVLGKCRDQIQ